MTKSVSVAVSIRNTVGSTGGFANNARANFITPELSFRGKKFPNDLGNFEYDLGVLGEG